VLGWVSQLMGWVGLGHIKWTHRQLWVNAQLQQRALKRCMTDGAIKTLTQAFIVSRLDYCNLLYCGIAKGLLSRLQSVRNVATRRVTGIGRRENTTPVLRQLHWTCYVQAGDFGPPLACRNCTDLPVRRVSPIHHLL